MDYAACRDALERAEADVTAAEFHGTLCAMLCTRPDLKMEVCVAEIAVCEHPPESSAWSRVLREHGERSRQAFAQGDFDLELLLPEDDASLAERSDALGEWCRGFLYGLGLYGGDISKRLSDDAREVVADLVEFTRLDVEEEASEQAEKAFLPMMAAALSAGGHLRVGMEDNVVFRRGQQVQHNDELVARAAELATLLQRPPIGTGEARELLGVKDRRVRRLDPITASAGT